MSNSKALLGFVAGAAVGALAGILFAPDKGSATRKKIKNKSGDLAESVKHKFSDLIAVSYTHLRAHETVLDLVCRLLLEKKKIYTYNKCFGRRDIKITTTIAQQHVSNTTCFTSS